MVTLQIPPARSPQEFLDSLYAWQSQVVRAPRLIQALHRGEASLAALQAYAKEKFFSHWHSGPEIAAMVSLARDWDTFLALAKNFSREAGFFQTENHTELYIRFCEALGLTRQELLDHVPMAETIGAFYTAAYFRRASLEEAIAAFSLASEGRKRAPQGEGQMRLSEALQRHYGLSPAAVEFFAIHEGEVEEEDIATGMALVATYITSPDQQARARRAFMLTTITKQRMYDAFDQFLAL